MIAKNLVSKKSFVITTGWKNKIGAAGIENESTKINKPIKSSQLSEIAGNQSHFP